MLLSEVGYFFKKNKIPIYCQDRYSLYKYIGNKFILERSIDFLEFGVYKGESFKYWVQMNNNPNSRFVGFDSFQGLPEKWDKVAKSLPEGFFNVDGHIPYVEDIRANFIKGWFQSTLEEFLETYNANDNLKIIHMDADLYSSTLFVLTKLDRYLVKGDIIIFDEFSSGDEYKAFLDYSSSYMRDVELISVSGPSYQQVAFIFL